ncbi:MAG: serine hydrolase [cyanobacterium endosymbiont of Rhopalodia musculus]|uniref:serine hydrolase n=1 Tax=cyanobacterium endosymbiont of Epithemia clementina EcSB TaxID=3034674 RepID=UPI002480FB43|nr:serine hydrolase [cyanobacterium endosymbiont of Epithemia clementina EcSB]WGT66688.1 class A beta-lactamase-related serine hydrolase [cyanobacterium endosymbiont of Epithemia clementina EcSB]
MPRRMINSSYNPKSSAINNDSSGRSINGKSSSRPQQINSVSGVGPSTRRLPRQRVSTSTVSAKLLDRRAKNSRSNLMTVLFLYILRLGIMGVGVSAITGTILTVFAPTSLLATYFNSTQLTASEESVQFEEKIPTATINNTTTIPPGKELTHLKTKLEKVASQEKYAKVKPQGWFIDLDNGNYVNFNGDTSLSAASTIKIPVLVAFFEELDAGRIYLDEMLTMDKEIITGGSGSMQYQEPGTKFSALETATKMIVISDNTATDMLVRRLGGKEVLNKRFKEWGLTSTEINNHLPDLEGTNTTSPKDLVQLLARVERGDLLTVRSRDRMLGIMQKTRTQTLLPQGLEQGAIISHKTGDIGTILGDAGIIDIPTGKRYIGAVFAERSYNDVMGRMIIQDFSRTVYQHLKWYKPNQNVKP